MQELSAKVASIFIGKKMRVNNEIYVIKSQNWYV